MAEGRVLAAGEHRRHELRVEGVAGIADGVDARVETMKPAFLDAPGDGGTIQPAGRELVRPDAPMLAGRPPRGP